MKGALLTAAVLLGAAQAGGTHKLKLKKVPLAEQLVCFYPFWNVCDSCLLMLVVCRRRSLSRLR